MEATLLIDNYHSTFPCNHSSYGISLPQFPANAPDILSAEMSGIPEILGNVQVNHAFLLRVNYENQSVVHNFFDSNLFLLSRVSRIQIRSFFRFCINN